MGLFIFFFVSSYRDSREVTFLSTERDVGECNEVRKPLSTSLLASNDGYWEGNINFLFARAPYKFTFNNLEIGSSAFRKEFARLLPPIRELDESMKENPIAINLLLWMTFAAGIELNDDVSLMELTGSPSAVFAQDFQYFFASNSSSINCTSTKLTFERETGIFQQQIQRNNQACWYFAEKIAENSGILEFANFIDDLVFRFDMNILTLAVSVNYGINFLDRFAAIAFQQILLEVTYDGEELFLVQFVPPDSRNEQRLACFADKEGNIDKKYRPYGCFLIVNNIPMIPIFYQVHPQCSTCDSPSLDICNRIDLVAGYVFVVRKNYTGYLDNSQQMRKEDVITLLDLRRALTYTGIVEAAKAGHFSNLPSGSVSQSLYDQCPNCAIINVAVHGNNKEVSKYGFRVENGHCESSLLVEETSRLGRILPAPIVESYYECRSDILHAFYNALGTAYGNMATFGQIGLFFIIPLIYWMLRATIHTPKRIYSADEVEYDSLTMRRATDEMITQLLKIRDSNKNEEQKQLNKDSILRRFVQELCSEIELNGISEADCFLGEVDASEWTDKQEKHDDVNKHDDEKDEIQDHLVGSDCSGTESQLQHNDGRGRCIGVSDPRCLGVSGVIMTNLDDDHLTEDP